MPAARSGDRGDPPPRVALDGVLQAPIFEASPVPMAVTRIRDGLILMANRACLEVLGWEAGDFIGRTTEEVRLWADPAQRAPMIERLRTDGRVRDFEADLRTRTGETRRVLTSIELVQVDGEPGLLGIFYDITDRKEWEIALQAARAEADRANRAKSEFLSRMSHELRTPLNAVLGFSELLALSDLPPAQLADVGQIRRAGRHLLALVDDVLDISRIETGDLKLSLEPVSLPDALRDAIELVRPLAAARDVVIDADRAGCAGFVLADRHRFQQVLLNLLSNGVKYNRPGGRIAVRCEPAGSGGVRTSISDTGIGIAAADLERIFRPFERLSATPMEVEGTGLGLALSKGLVEAMQGTIGATSRVGEGSTFWIELKRADPPGEDLGRAAKAAPGTVISSVAVTGTVLYIEDNLSNLQLVEGILAKRPGVDLVSAMQGTLGLELAAARRPDLILLDLHLPDMPGEEVLQRLRAEPATAETPIVVISADATRGQVARLISRGATDYLTKPFEIRRLLGWVDRALGGDADPELGDAKAEHERERVSPQAPPGLDPGQLASLRELDDNGEGLRRLAELFCDDVPQKTDELSRAARAGNLQAVAAAAHKLKGSAAIIGASSLAAVASAIETLAKAGTLPDDATLTELRRAADAATAAVGSLLAGSDGDGPPTEGGAGSGPGV